MGKWYYQWIPTSIFDFFHNHSPSSKMMLSFLKITDPELLETMSENKVLKLYQNVRTNIPAYKKFLKKCKVDKADEIKDIIDFNAILPVVDKHNYVMQYPLIERTFNHRLPKHGLIVESSGSTTKDPTNWFRTYEEEQAVARDVAFESRYLFGDKEYIIISCWSLGAWTTSLSFCSYFEQLGVVKNIGPDIEQVIKTLKFMGPKYNYIIAGYPPFVKHLIDTNALPWKKYNINFVVGGEGFIPGWRKYMLSKVKKGAKIISAYGASDLETGMAVETPLCQCIRDLFATYPKKVQKAFGIEELPSFFQYNPLRFYINNLPETKEFHTTVMTHGTPSVMVKYNVKDFGAKLSYNEMISIMNASFSGFGKRHRTELKSSLKLPFLWVAGRSDDVISLDGSKMYPQKIEMALLKDKRIYKSIQSFQTTKSYHNNGSDHFLVKIQLQEGVKPSKQLAKKIKNALQTNLSRISKAYKLGLHDLPSCYEPHVELYEFHNGPFDVEKIKNKYVVE